MAAYKPFQCTYGDIDEIAFTSRNDMNLAVWEGEGRLRLYTYNYDDTFRERVGRFLHDGITKLWDEEQLFDLEVHICRNVFKCHGVIMASVSSFFKDELTSVDRQVGQPNVIVLDGGRVKPEIFQYLLEFIYKGKEAAVEDHTLDILKAAIYLKIRSLEHRCFDVLVKKLSERSCLKIWDWAETNNIPSLASKAKGVALTHFQVLRHTEEFLHIPIERLTMMLGHDLLQYRCEDDILEAILDWVKFNTEDRQYHLKELLPFVCFPYLSSRYLNDLRKHELIGLRTEFASYVDEALTYHLAALQKDGKQIQMEILKHQAYTLKRMLPGMRQVVVLIGGSVIQNEPLTSVVACYMDNAHPLSHFRQILHFSIASMPQPLGLHFASSVCKQQIFVSGGTRAPDSLIVYKPHKNSWHCLEPLPEGRENHAMVSLDGQLYLLGGRSASSQGQQIVSEVIVYDIEAKTWKQSGKLCLAVEEAAAVAVADRIYVFGGRDASGDSVQAVQCLYTATGQVEIVGELPVGMAGAKAIVLGKNIVLICPNGSIFKISENSVKNKVSRSSDDSDACLSSFLSDNSLQAISLKDEEVAGAEDGNSWQRNDLKVTEGSLVACQEGERFQNEEEAVEAKMSEVQIRFQPTEQKSAEKSPPVLSKWQNEEKSPPVLNKWQNEEKWGRDDQEVDHSDKEGNSERIVETAEGNSDSTDETAEGNCSDVTEENCPDVTGERCPEAGYAHEEDEDKTESILGDQGEKQKKEDSKSTSQTKLTLCESALKLTIRKIATMEKRRDFGLFIRKADVMVVGGQAENGNFLDDILRIHVPTGQVCKTDIKLAIPLSGMQVECTAIHQNYLMQFFDAATCFYWE